MINAIFKEKYFIISYNYRRIAKGLKLTLYGFIKVLLFYFILIKKASTEGRIVE